MISSIGFVFGGASVVYSVKFLMPIFPGPTPNQYSCSLYNLNYKVNHCKYNYQFKGMCAKRYRSA